MQTMGNKENRVLLHACQNCRQMWANRGCVLLSTLSRRAASRTSQGLAELAHENKKVDSQSTFRQLVHLLGLFSACSPNFGQTLSLSSRKKRRKKKNG